MSWEDRFPLPQVGRLDWIGVRPERRVPMRIVEATELRVDMGLVGDRARSGKRQVTLVQAEHLPVVAALLGLDALAPEVLRRNLVVSGINLAALVRRPFRIGGALLEGTGLAHPCSRMEEALGPGAWNALRGHGGITARVLNGGVIRIGDPVALAEPGPGSLL